MISHSHKFILILPPKTASTSIADSLLPYANILKTKQKGPDRLDFYEKTEDYRCVGIWELRKHAPLSSYHDLHLESYKLFCTVRNPFDRAYSVWKWLSRLSDIKFDEWILNLNTDHMMNQTQLSHLNHHSVKLIDINFIKFENLQQDFDGMCHKISAPRRQLPHKNKTDHKHYTEYYNDETREIVAEKYAQDIEYFGYEFGE